jgi:hypothetical protein
LIIQDILKYDQASKLSFFERIQRNGRNIIDGKRVKRGLSIIIKRPKEDEVDRRTYYM